MEQKANASMEQKPYFFGCWVIVHNQRWLYAITKMVKKNLLENILFYCIGGGGSDGCCKYIILLYCLYYFYYVES